MIQQLAQLVSSGVGIWTQAAWVLPTVLLSLSDFFKLSSFELCGRKGEGRPGEVSPTALPPVQPCFSTLGFM